MPDSRVLILVDAALDGAEPGSDQPETVPVPLALAAALDMATAVAAAEKAAVLVLSVIEVAAEKSLTEGTLAAQTRRKQLAVWNRAWAHNYRAAVNPDSGP